MLYLTTHSTHFVYGYMEVRKEMFYLTPTARPKTSYYPV